MARSTKLFTPPKPTSKATSKNREQYPAWNLPWDEALVQTLLTNTLGQVFYASQKEMMDESKFVHDEALKQDKGFYAKALVYARNEGYMRLQPVYGLARLASEKGPSDELRQAFPGVIRTPDDLRDFSVIYKSLTDSHGARKVKRAAGNWLASRLSEYWAIKYGSEEKSGYSLRDMVQLYHPDTQDTKVKQILDYIMGQVVDDPDGLVVTRTWKDKHEHYPLTLEQLVAFERLKRAKTEKEKIAEIVSGRLPHEVSTPFLGTSRALWEAVGSQMPIFALLRHLATLERHGALQGLRTVVEEKFTNQKIVLNSKIFPFEFLEAMEHISVGWVQDALRDAISISLGNMPDLGKTAVLLDTSGSMRNRFLDIAKLFAVSLAMRSEGPLYAFDSHTYVCPVSKRDSLLTQAQAIELGDLHAKSKKRIKEFSGVPSGTWTSGPLEVMIANREKVDCIVCITDGQQNQGEPFADVLAKYREQFSPQCQLFVLDVSPYLNAPVPEGRLNFRLAGWSDRALKFIALAKRGFGTLAQSIRESRVVAE